MRILKIYTLLLILSFALGSCEQLLDPEKDNHSTKERVYEDPGFAEGLLMSAYVRLPTSSLSYTDIATSDGVSSDKLNSYLRMATGQWSAIFNPIDQWQNCNEAILYINNFIDIIDTVAWKWTNNEMNSLFARRFYGEAYALRALFQYHLLVSVAGYGTDNALLGIPLYDKTLNANDKFNTPRASFTESINKIYADFDKALLYLVDDYKDITSLSQLPAGFTDVTPVTATNTYNIVFGSWTAQRISGRIVKALKARVALFEASPAFSADDPVLWAKAANYAGVVLNSIGGIAGLDRVGHRYFDNTRVDAINLANNIEQKEIIWRSAIVASNTRESWNYPPSLYGNGIINPSQNIVDAFPDANGYPISDPSTIYNATSPYLNRDPRLAQYIVYNGSTFAAKTIKTGLGGGFNAKDSIQTSTRTGYYLRKLLREDVNLDPISINTNKHYEVFIRYTELYLIYAEAANEAWGPDVAGTNGFTSRDVIRAIRNRAGIVQSDAYLATIAAGDKAGMRTLIRNERRIELCFEGFRFWDLRRWNVDLTEKVRGVQINGTSYTYVDVEERKYDNSYMHYGPLPDKEVVKYNLLLQNKGW